MQNIIPILALRDNYIWLLFDRAQNKAVIVDPGTAKPVLDVLQQEQLTLTAILITHHHWDHTAGIDELVLATGARVYGPKHDGIADLDVALVEGDVVQLPEIGRELRVFDIPAHTKGHIAYYDQACIFTGDTLFTAGCGRLFEGDAAQMYAALQKIAALPEQTLVYCGHEYTAANLEFASHVEPENPAIRARIAEVEDLRVQNLPTTPASLAIEKQTNPFLRCHIAAVRAAAETYLGKKCPDPIAVLQALRTWKDNF